MSKVKVGVSRVCITPPLVTPMAGHYYRRFTKGVIDDIYATALVFGDEKEKVAYALNFVSCFTNGGLMLVKKKSLTFAIFRPNALYSVALIRIQVLLFVMMLQTELKATRFMICFLFSASEMLLNLLLKI